MNLIFTVQPKTLLWVLILITVLQSPDRCEAIKCYFCTGEIVDGKAGECKPIAKLTETQVDCSEFSNTTINLCVINKLISPDGNTGNYHATCSNVDETFHQCLQKKMGSFGTCVEGNIGDVYNASNECMGERGSKRRRRSSEKNETKHDSYSVSCTCKTDLCNVKTLLDGGSDASKPKMHYWWTMITAALVRVGAAIIQ